MTDWRRLIGFVVALRSREVLGKVALDDWAE